MELAQLGALLPLLGGACLFLALGCNEEGDKQTARLICLIGVAYWLVLFASLFLNLVLDQACSHLAWSEACDLLHQVKQIIKQIMI